MAKYISIRTYKLKPGVEPAAFERAFAGVGGALGLERVVLLKGYQGDLPSVAGAASDYVSLHIYESPEGCARFIRPAYEGEDDTAYPEALRPFVQAILSAGRGETATSTVDGYTLVHGTV